jgi:hypothetical protein
MSILVRYVPESATVAQYDETIQTLNDRGLAPPEGCEYHVAYFVDGKLRVSEIWESQEKFAAFGEHLMPILAEIGVNPGEPEILEVHNTLTQ